MDLRLCLLCELSDRWPTDEVRFALLLVQGEGVEGLLGAALRRLAATLCGLLSAAFVVPCQHSFVHLPATLLPLLLCVSISLSPSTEQVESCNNSSQQREAGK